MSAAADALASHRDQIWRKGTPVAIRRFTGEGSPPSHVDVVTRGFVTDNDATVVAGVIKHGGQTAIVLADDLAGLLPLRRGSDKLVTDFTLVDGVVTGGAVAGIADYKRRRVAGTLIALEILTS